MPEISQVHASMALTNVSVAYRNPAFIADTLAPPVPVRKQQDKYFIVDSERESFRSTPDHRAPAPRPTRWTSPSRPILYAATTP
jgi:hypothetical protein